MLAHTTDIMMQNNYIIRVTVIC